jgi:dihydropyrimidine dehydrogenase (NAD+) subunit PreA
MSALNVDFCGVSLRSPVGVAAQAPFAPGSTDPDKMAALLMKHVNHGAGFVHTPYTTPEKEHPADKLPTGRFLKEEIRGFGKVGFWCMAESYRIEMRLDTCLKMMRILKEMLPDDVALIANIMGPGADPEGWADHAKVFEEEGADLIELDVSCPLPAAYTDAVKAYMSERVPEGAGVLVGDVPKLTATITKEAVKKCSIPVGVKMSPEVGFPRLIGFVEELVEAGAAFITSINAPLSVAPPDIYNMGRGKYAGIEYNSISPALGPWTRYLCYRNIGTISMFIPSIEQAAVGGLVLPEHVVEAIMLGATITELSSGTLWKGWPLIERCNKFLKKYMKEQEFESINDFRGIGVRYIRPAEEIDWRLGEIVAKVDLDKCTHCGICTAQLCFAMFSGEKGPEVDVSECSGCSLCSQVCPSGAIHMVEV